MNNKAGELLNAHVLKPETVRAVTRAGYQEVQIIDRWLGGWPRETRKLEKEGRLIAAAKEQKEREDEARHYLSHHTDIGLIEALEMFDIPLNPPA